MTSLLQEIISVYPLLNPSQLTAAASNRVCNALALLQCVASHPDTRGLFLGGMYLSPHPLSSYIANHTSHSPHPPLPLPLPKHHLQISPLRIPTPNLPRRHRRPSQKRQLRSDKLPPHHRNHPPLPPYHGDRQRTQQDSRDLHRAKDPAG